MVARRRLAIVDVDLAANSGESERTFARVSGHRVSAYATVAARAADTIVYIGLTSRTGETGRTRTLVAVNQIGAVAAVETRIRQAFVYIDFALRARITCIKAKKPNQP